MIKNFLKNYPKTLNWNKNCLSNLKSKKQKEEKMVVKDIQTTSSSMFSATTKVKEKSTSADEFQAALNEVKNKEDKEDKKTSSSEFTNEDLDLSAVKEDFKSYAWQKMREDQYKKNEEDLLNKLFATIDAGNTAKI